MSDPNGHCGGVCTAAVVGYALFEAAMSLYDAYDVVATTVDPNATIADKGITVGGAVAGAFLPGGGWGTIGRSVKNGRAMLSKTTTFGRREAKSFQSHHIISPKNKLTRNNDLFALYGWSKDKIENSVKNRINLPVRDGLHPKRSIHRVRHFKKVSVSLAQRINAIVRIGRTKGWKKDTMSKRYVICLQVNDKLYVLAPGSSIMPILNVQVTR